jgi:hypothetical protein
MRTLIILICAILLTAAGQSLAADSWFSDNFNDGAINTTNWSYGGGISQSGGVLNLDRDNAEEDYIKTAHTYSGNFVVQLDIRLNSIHSNDAFHGITIADSMGQGGYGINGVSLGFTNYGKLYCGLHEDWLNGFVYSTASGTNLAGQWQHWTLTKNGNYLNILVNGQQVAANSTRGPYFGGNVPDTVSIYLPGYHNYGSGGIETDITSSSVDNFSISPVPEPASAILIGAGLFFARLSRRRR